MPLWTPSQLGTDLWAHFDFSTQTPPTTGGGLTNLGTIPNLVSGQPGLNIANGAGSANGLVFASNGISLANGTVAWVQFASALPSAWFDLAFVGTPNAAGSFRTFMANSGGTWHHVLLNTGSNSIGTHTNGGYVSSGLTWPSQLGQLVTTIPNATGIQMSRDGGTMTAVATTFTGGSNQPVLLNYATGGTQGWGTLNELIITAPGILAANPALVQGYLAHRWDGVLGGTALVTALPSGHTYKSAAPTTGGSGPWVKVGGIWKQASVFVKHSGTWKAATVSVKSGGTWKAT